MHQEDDTMDSTVGRDGEHGTVLGDLVLVLNGAERLERIELTVLVVAA